MLSGEMSHSWLAIFLFSFQWIDSRGLSFSINPLNNAFFLYSSTFPRNFSHRLLYLQDDCPSSTDQQLSVTSGNKAHNLAFLPSLSNLHCAVNVKLVQDTIRMDRPYVDVISVADSSYLSALKQSICVAIKITSPSADTVSSTCHLSPFEDDRQTCLTRIQIPHLWFGPVGSNFTKQTLSMSYTVSSNCNVPFYDRPQVPIHVLPYVDNAQSFTLADSDVLDLSLLSRANATLSLRSLNAVFAHLSYNSTKPLTSLEIRLFLDARVDLLSVATFSRDAWTIRASSAPRPEVYTSITCTPKKPINNWQGYLFSLILKMRGAIAENKRLEHGEEGLEAVLHWEVQTSTTNGTKETVGKAGTTFRVTPDVVYAIVPIAKSTEIINTGMFSGKQSSTSMRIFSVTLGGQIKDVTSSSHCLSAESKVLKTSPTCSSVYVDGSEMRGMSKIEIHVHFEKWTTSISFTVWYPRLPITLWLKDPVLNAINEWPVAKWRELKENRQQKRAAKQFACSSRYQQTEVLVLASFQVTDERTGEIIFLSGDRDLNFDVTSLAVDRIQSSNRSVAVIRRLQNRVLVQAVGPGSTTIVLKRRSPDIDYGSSTVVVTSDSVVVDHLSALPLVQMQLQMDPVNGRRRQYDVTANIDTIFRYRYQHASFFYQLHYSDETVEPLDDVTSGDFQLRAISLDEKMLGVRHVSGSDVDLIALDDVIDPSAELELRAAAHCIDSDVPPLTSTIVPLQLLFNDRDSSRHAAMRAFDAINETSHEDLYEDDHQSMWRMDSILIFILSFLFLVCIVRFVAKRTNGFRGYEKLVAPILSRLSSSSSGEGRDEDTKEWVWLSKARIDSNSIGSRYSQKSTINAPEQSSPSYDENTHTSISYRGSEISVFISPTPVITVHTDKPSGGSWRSNGGRSRTRAARHALVDSSSDHNLARIVARSGSWREEANSAWPNHTWNAKRRPPPNYEGMRESVA